MGKALPVIFLVLVVVLLPLQAVAELPGEKELKTALGFDYPKSCDDYETVGKGTFGAWRRERSLPDLRDEPRATRIGDTVFLAGGTVELDSGSTSVATFETFNLRTGRYRELPDLPIPLNHTGLAAYRGDVYMTGGFKGTVDDPVTTDQVWRYSVEEGAWERLAPLPSSRGAHGVAVIGDRMYVIGGRGERQVARPGGSLASVDAYDFARDEWTSVAPMAQARDHLGVATYDGKIYALAGRPGSGKAFRTLERYDPRADRWQRLEDYPLPASGIGFEAVHGRLVAAGGEDPGRDRLIGEAWSYDIRSDSWTQLPSMPRPKHGYGSTGTKDRFWAFGGAECYGFEPSDSVDSLKVQ